MKRLEVPDHDVERWGAHEDYPPSWGMMERVRRDLAVALGQAGIDWRRPLTSWYDPACCVTVYEQEEP